MTITMTITISIAIAIAITTAITIAITVTTTMTTVTTRARAHTALIEHGRNDRQKFVRVNFSYVQIRDELICRERLEANQVANVC